MATDIIARGLVAGEAARNRSHRVLALSRGIVPQAGNAIDQTAQVKALLDELSQQASAGAPLRLVLAPGTYNLRGLVIPANVIIEGAGWRSQTWYPRQVRFQLPAGATAGAMLSVASGTNGWGLRGIELIGSHAAGFRALDIINARHFHVDGCSFVDWGEQALRAASGPGFCHLGAIRHNLAYNCLMQRSRAALAGVFELDVTDTELAGNEASCSATFEGVNQAAAALYNAQPRLAACWLTGGGMNTVRDNIWEISEIGLVDDSYCSQFSGNRFEFNKAWGLLSRQAGGTHQGYTLNGNSRAGNGLYAHVRVEALSDGQLRRSFANPTVANNETAWSFTTTALATFEDVVFDSFPTYCDPTFYAVTPTGDNYPVTIRTNDPRIRALGPKIPVSRGQNGIRNSVLNGAVAGVIGAGGALPADCEIIGGTGQTRTLVGSGIDAGLEYVDIRFQGTASENYVILSFHPNGGLEIPAALAGESWTASLFVRVAGGSMDNINAIYLSAREYPADGWNTINVGSAAQIRPPQDSRPLDLCRFETVRVVANAATRRMSMWLQIVGTGAASAYDITLRIAAPQLEQAAVAGLPVRTTGRALLPRVIDRQAPASGASIVIASRVEHLMLEPAAPLATLSLTLPEAPQDGDVVTVSSTQPVAALTMAASAGHALLNPAASLAAGGTCAWRFRASGAKWFRVARGEFEPGAGGGVNDGDKGDITVSGGGATWTIDSGSVGSAKLADGAVGSAKLADGAVTLAKHASVASGTLRGRASSGAGVPEDLSPAQARALLGRGARVLSANVTSNAITPALVTDATNGNWSIPVTAGERYRISLIGAYQTDTVTTGCTVGLYASGAAGTLTGEWRGAISAAAVATELAQPMALNAARTTTGVSAINTAHFVRIEAVFACTTGGTLELRFASEVAASVATLLAGSALMWEAV